MLVLHFAYLAAAVYATLSFSEYSVHRFAMHRMRIANRLKSRFLKRLCYNHMALHHKRPYHHTDDAKDDHVSEVTATGLVPVAPLLVLLYFVYPFAFNMLFVGSIIYGICWWVVHNEMHDRRGRFFAKTAVFRYLEERHQLHHLHPGTNFNLVLPLWDWVLRTEAIPTGKTA